MGASPRRRTKLYWHCACMHACNPNSPAAASRMQEDRKEPACINETTGARVQTEAKGPTVILGLKAFGLRSRIASTADCRVDSCSRLLQQLMQLQPSQ